MLPFCLERLAEINDAELKLPPPLFVMVMRLAPCPSVIAPTDSAPLVRTALAKESSPPCKRIVASFFRRSPTAVCRLSLLFRFSWA